jgi:predicted Zn-dependent protease
LKESSKHPFWSSLKAYGLLENGKVEDSQELMKEIKPTKQTDPIIVKFLTLTLIKLGKDAECTKMLEGACNEYPDRSDLAEQLFFAYMRQNKLMKM